MTPIWVSENGNSFSINRFVDSNARKSARIVSIRVPSGEGIRLEPRGDALAFFPRRRVPTELRDQLRQHKTELLHLLRGEVTATEPAAVAIADPVPTAAPAR